MEILTGIYLGYSFLSFYMLFLFILIYVQNRKFLYDAPGPKKNYELSVVFPCFNVAEVIEESVENMLSTNYKFLKKVILVDDCSTDNSWELLKGLEKKYPNVMAVQTPKQTGNAAGAKNYGAKFVETELIAFSDDDSRPAVDAIDNMIGFFNDENVAAVTSKVLVKRRNNVLERIQSIEYKIMAFTRKLLNFVDGVYVTNGPLSIYRMDAFEKIGGFDVNNLTEDIEITWHFVAEGYRVCMGLGASVYTFVPKTVKHWFVQRLRWNLGGVQTIMKYKKSFLRKGMVGKFILPFFVMGWLIGLFGILVLGYRMFTRIIFQYFSTSYSVASEVAIITFKDVSLVPNVLVFFGVLTLFLSLVFTSIALLSIREKGFKRNSLWTLIVYMFFYLLAYPIILITAFYKYLRGYNKWGRRS
ncbi:MAG: glycosyltransferase family 2 protein [Candidatus Pacearchaeota archaeon]|nr:glycosyltransferase family 2 protein [Candidatus Pacearchaeota archaeon]